MLNPGRVQRVAADAVLRDGHRVLLVWAGAASGVPGTWFLPGGGVEHGEHPRMRSFARSRKRPVIDARRVLSSACSRPRRSYPSAGRCSTRSAASIAQRSAAGALRDEVAGTTDKAAWLAVDKALALPLAPFVGEVLMLGPAVS